MHVGFLLYCKEHQQNKAYPILFPINGLQILGTECEVADKTNWVEKWSA
ncbi:hypothetical protein QAA98_06740 [Glaesserella parasuis]|nr:hypothetical protein [Glaesserella parasuis]